MYRLPISIVLTIVLTNDKSHQHDQGKYKAGYSGLFQLTSVAQHESPFVTTYADLNLEHYFDARQQPTGEIFFEPRYAPMSLQRHQRNQLRITPITDKHFWS